MRTYKKRSRPPGPIPLYGKKMVQYKTTMSVEQLDRITAAASRQGKTIPELLREMIERYVK